MDINKKQRRIFHFFERAVGLTSYSQVVDLAIGQYPEMPVDDAVNTFWLKAKEAQKAKDALSTNEYYSDTHNKESMEYLMKAQFVEP